MIEGGKYMNKNQERSQRPYCGSVENFLEIGKSQEKAEKFKNPWEYDFKYEYSNENSDKYWNLDEETDVIKRLLKYKANDNGFDCDGTGEKDACELPREIYRRLWDWVDICNSQKKRYGAIGLDSISIYGPDTMNSFMTLFCSVLKEQKGKNTGNTILDDYKGRIEELYDLKQRHISSLFLYRLFVEQEEKIKVRLEDYLNSDLTLWHRYAEICHVIGNFVLVPAGFNPKRSNMFKDFWDLSLLYLKGQVKDNIWLSSSNLFVKYINYFFLWDYVICNEKQSDYYVKSMLLNSDIFMSVSEYRTDVLLSHDRQMPDETEIPDFIENAQWTVKRRGIFMTAMLRLQAEIGGEKYGKLRKEVFAADTPYENFEAVIEIILKWLENNGITADEITETLNTLKAEQKWETVIEQKLH